MKNVCKFVRYYEFSGIIKAHQYRREGHKKRESTVKNQGTTGGA